MSSLQVNYEPFMNVQSRLSEAVHAHAGDICSAQSLIPDLFSGLTIALIGPDEDCRKAVAHALAVCKGSEIHDFTSYPPSLDGTPALLAETHNVVMIELDSDPNFAIDLVESIVAAGPTTVMVYSTKADPEILVRCMRAGAREFLTPPFTSPLLAESLLRIMARYAQDCSSGVKEQPAMGRLLPFMGAKGGTGVTTLACNFAVALAQHPKQKTLLIDLDLPLGDVALNLGIVHEYSTVSALQAADRLDSSFLSRLVAKHQSGLSVLAAPGNLRDYDVSNLEIDKLLTVAQQTFDNVVVDMGSRIDLTTTALFRNAHTFYLVTQAGIPELRNSNRLIRQFFSEAEPKLEIVINRYEPRPFGVSDSDVDHALTRPAHWKIPNDYASVKQMQIDATPLAISQSPVCRQIRQMTRALNGEPIAPEKKKVFSLFG